MTRTILLYVTFASIVCFVTSEIKKETPENVKSVGSEIKTQAKNISAKLIEFRKLCNNLEHKCAVKGDGFRRLKELLEDMEQVHKSQCPSEIPKLIKKIITEIKELHKFINLIENTADIEDELNAIENVIAEKEMNDKHKMINVLERDMFGLYYMVYEKKISLKVLELKDMSEDSELRNKIQEMQTRLSSLMKKIDLKSIIEKEIEEMIHCKENSAIKINDFIKNGEDFSNDEQDVEQNIIEIAFCLSDISRAFAGWKYKALLEHVEEIEKALKERLINYDHDQQINAKKILNLMENKTITDFRSKLGNALAENKITFLKSAYNVYHRAAEKIRTYSDNLEKAIRNTRSTEVTVENTAEIVFALLQDNENKLLV